MKYQRLTAMIYLSAAVASAGFVLTRGVVSRVSDGSVFDTAMYLLCFLSSLAFGFAAAAVRKRPAIAHCLAISGLIGAPWIYRTVTLNFEIANLWTEFNVPDRDIRFYDLLYVELTILGVAIITIGIVVATFRLLPSNLHFRKVPLRERIWPAVAASVIVLAIWFAESVTPYRIPGAVDYYRFPVLQILHVEKHGLQFHETSFSFYIGRAYELFSFSRNDRRLFEYRFQRKTSSGLLPEPLAQRAQAIIDSPEFAKSNFESSKPLRTWNAEGWYVGGTGAGLVSYTTEKGNAPPHEVLDLFQDVAKIPRSKEITQPDTKDVCLGFCYDPLAELGWLYSNHRCFNQGRGFICR